VKIFHGKYQDLPPDKLKNIYLDRYAWPGPLIADKPDKRTKIIVVIPCFNEPDILESLQSLYNCDPINCFVEVIVVINHGEHADQKIKEFNITTVAKIKKWKNDHKKPGMSFHLIKAYNLPKKHAGVGLARKIGMDEAVRRFEYINEKKGIIACFDADCICSSNYLKEIELLYNDKPKSNVALIHFEHPLEGKSHHEVYDSIINYELHLRYYKNALKYAQFPYSFHTVGSCITVASETYQKQGGMNKKKAGEDFYFLQKVFPHGGIENITSAAIFPSPRPSDRVPFGTGKAVNEILNNSSSDYYTYNSKIFLDLKSFIDVVPSLFQKKDIKSMIKELPVSVQEYLENINFSSNILKIKLNCNSEKQFLKSFYQWFNGFTLLKYVHFARDNFHENIEVLEASNWILAKLTKTKDHINNKRLALKYLRALDRSDQ